MTCPYCQSEKSRVTKTIHGPGRVTRYRRCLSCKKTFPTVEFVNLRIDRRSRMSLLASAHVYL
jgi:transcriptional regulator NrdR family protein